MSEHDKEQDERLFRIHDIGLDALKQAHETGVRDFECLHILLSTICHATFDVAPDQGVAYRTILSAVEEGRHISEGATPMRWSI